MQKFNLSAFDDSFFAEQEFAETQDQFHLAAQEALGSILTVTDDSGAVRSKEQIEQETEVFFSNSWVAESFSLMDSLAQQYAHFCSEHEHMSPQTENTLLSSVKDRGDSLNTREEGQLATKNKETDKDKKKKKKKQVKNKKGTLQKSKLKTSKKLARTMFRLF